MRWYSLNGVPRGSKNGSGAIIRMCIGVTAAGCGEDAPFEGYQCGDARANWARRVRQKHV